ncbi:ABC transporter substrate-binding protein [Thioclava dalianensis]|uniref:ABC transporter substrate-binding protein n=1 Tax=Thioclava dalianensis TaxID=1185766 RepID=A0A074TLX9_9RHOB|nr:ABC transporter substrate-binding protein [Thioclava dalianensis]KEP71170.1 ABC transporter substrate-binding protein [Thioclava dalianensis]SFN23466.1 alpha-1,4-digalacturonate transport system substrate-binding protein [Thioclava dalianensis]
MIQKRKIAAAAVAATFLAATAASAEVQLRFECAQDGNECDTMMTIFKQFEAKHPDIKVKMDLVPYKAILENLPVDLAAGTGPDLAKVTDLGGLHKYYLDLSPYVEKTYWEDNFGKTLDWYRAGPQDKGIYGLQTQLTITGAFVNKTLFDQANVALPGKDATWDDWAKASREVAKATGTRYPMAMDRSGHRFAGLAIPYGATYFDADGNPELNDPGFAAASKQFVAWNADGTMDRNVWAGQGGTSYADATKEFVNGELVFYYSGSWQIQKFADQIGDAFDWEVVPAPCGPAGPGHCSGMPGGSGVVGFKSTKHPKEVAELLNYLAQPDNYAMLEAKSLNIPANATVAKAGVKYEGATPGAAKALNAFSAQVPTISPVGYAYQGYKNNRAMFNITVTRLTQAIVGELSLTEALDRMSADLKQAVNAAQ